LPAYYELVSLAYNELRFMLNHPEESRFAVYEDIYKNIYKNKYPDHPYTDKMEMYISGISLIVGGKYIDFTAPDADGKDFKLSEQIAGKIALIDLWASWCGGCRLTSKSMIPVYEKYKDKGFTIVGIAREKSVIDMVRAAERDGYPWLNLVELNDRGKIWQRYGVGNAGGSTFLVDQTGTILAVHPTAEEVMAILESSLTL
jgi:peroxiredoxin